MPNSPYIVAVKERELTVVGGLDLNSLEGEEVDILVGITVNMKGNIAVTDNGKHSVYIFDKNGKFLRKIRVKGPRGVAYLNDDEILIVDTNNDRIRQTDIQTATVVGKL